MLRALRRAASRLADLAVLAVACTAGLVLLALLGDDDPPDAPRR